MDQEQVVVCRRCGQGWQGAKPGDRCPNNDDGVLITVEEHRKHPSDPVLGSVIAGKYVVIQLLGGGGFGAVYRAVQEPVSRPVAIKVISPDAADDAGDLRARFYREARVVAQLNDPATVTLYDYGEEPDGSLFMVFEYIEGRLLADILHEETRLGPPRAVALAQQVLGALAEAHARGLVHRDLKPGNLIVTQAKLRGEKIKVLDFGIAKLLGPEGVDDVKTREGIVLGTPRYMSPEQSTDRPLDGRSDLYALGVMLYQMLTGRVPFDGAAPLDILMAHISAPVPPIPADLDVPAGLAEAVYRALAKRPEDRFPDAEAMSRALDEALQAHGLRAGPLVESGAQPAQPRPARPTPAGLPAPRITPPPPAEEPELSPTEESRLARRERKSGAGRAIAIVAVAALITGGLVIGGLKYFRKADEAPEQPTPPDEPVKVTFAVGNTPPAALQPAIALAREGELDKAAAALKSALEGADDRDALLQAARETPELGEVLRRADLNQ